MALRVVLTQDGSPTLQDANSGSYYHSLFGAAGEARHVFLGGAQLVRRFQEPELALLEVGFGTGLNFALTAMAALQAPDCKLKYTAYEPNAISPALLDEFYAHYPIPHSLVSLLKAGQGKIQNVELQVIGQRWPATQLPKPQQVVYYDAFAPTDEPMLWEQQAIAAAIACLVPGGVFVTYSVTGHLKRILKQLPVRVERLPGFAPKREMLRATRLTHG